MTSSSSKSGEENLISSTSSIPDTAISKSGQDNSLPIFLSFVAGFIEAVCFVGLFHTFTAFITGTILFLVVDLVSKNDEYVTKLVVAISFFAFTFIWAVLIRRLQRHGKKLKSILIGLEAIFVFAFMAAGMLFEPLPSADSPATIAVAFIAVIAMSLHSTNFFMLLNKQPPTQFMTGNLTNFVVNAVDSLGLGKKTTAADPALNSVTKFKLWHYSTIFILFFVGVAAGTWGLMNFGFVVLALPATVLLITSVHSLYGNRNL